MFLIKIRSNYRNAVRKKRHILAIGIIGTHTFLRRPIEKIPLNPLGR